MTRMRLNAFHGCRLVVIAIALGSLVLASRALGQAPGLPTAEPAGRDPKAASSNHAGLSPIELATRLETAKQQEERLDIELRTGKSYIRCRLLRLERAGGSGPPKTLRVELEESQKSISVEFAAIRSLTIGREVMYKAAVDKPSARDAKAEKEAKAAAEARAQWVARAIKNGVLPWPELTNEQHNAAIEENRKTIEKVKSMFPSTGVELYETSEFMFCSNIPRNQVGPYVASLDRMHDMMCNMYGIKKGTPVWLGKCLVVAFVEKSQFVSFEREFFHNNNAEIAYGICHQQVPSGRVVMSCYRGNDPNDFGQMLVHETSHGFNFRYRTQRHLPSWVDEGMAEWIGSTLVPTSSAVRRKEQASLRTLQATHSMQGVLDADPIIEIPNSYGMASSLTTFLVRADQKKYVAFINGIKEGKSWQDSLKDAYHGTVEQMVAEYGRAIGIPDLKP
jgi:hypothetical protein